jgi:hypothetical protein
VVVEVQSVSLESDAAYLSLFGSAPDETGISDHLLESVVFDPDYQDFRFASTGVINDGFHKTILSDGILPQQNKAAKFLYDIVFYV